MNRDTAQLNLAIDSDLKYNFKIATARPGLDMTKAIEVLIRSYLDMTEDEREALLKKYSE